MGTSADFYVVRRGERLGPEHWRGSVAENGHPAGVGVTTEGMGRAAFDLRLEQLAADGRWHDRTLGWPWTWPDSRGTDFAYVLILGLDEPGADDDLEAFRFGQRIRLPGDPELGWPDCGPLRPAPKAAKPKPARAAQPAAPKAPELAEG